MRRLITLCLLSLTLIGCTNKEEPSIYAQSQLQQSRREFEQGYYKRAMYRLLPLSCEGNAEAQYAIGYMYYYGYGVPLDKEIGMIWIKTAAAKHYPPATTALGLIQGKYKDIAPTTSPM